MYLGVEDFELLENQISLYPNPVKGVLFVDTPENLIVNRISIYNILGTKIKSFSTDFESLDFSNLNFGMYFLEFDTDKGSITKK